MALVARRSGALAVALMAVVAGLAGADFAADSKMCADKLAVLATCLPFVEATATARAPTPDCCAGLREVLGGSKLCLCVLIKDRDEPALGIKVNVTRAMDLPSACSVPAVLSDCPQLLHISPDSKEAQIFRQYASEHEGKNATTTAGTTGAGGKSADAASGAGRNTVVFGIDVVLTVVLTGLFLLA